MDKSSCQGPYIFECMNPTKTFTQTSMTGNAVFAVQDNVACFTAANAKDTYKMHGEATTCHADGTGGGWGNAVYEIKCGELFQSSDIPFLRVYVLCLS